MVAQVLRLGGNLVLAGLLFPEAFGLMALVNLVMWTLQAVSDVGINAAIVRHARDDDDFVDTAWTLQVLRGLVLWVIGVAMAHPIARFFGEPELASLVPAACASAILMGFSSTKVVTLTRNVAPGRIVAIEVGSQAVALVVTVWMAWVYRSVWALVIGGLVATLLRVIGSHVLVPGRANRFAWDRSAARELIEFGRWVTLSTTFNFLAFRMDLALVGMLVPIETLGVYSIGITLSNIVREVLVQINRLVVLPTLSAAFRAGPDTLPSGILRLRDGILPTALTGTIAAITIAPALFTGLYDDRYHDAAWIAQLSMAAVWFSFLCDVSGTALLAIGDSRSWAVSTAVKALVTTLACLAGHRIAGVPGLIIGGAAAALATYFLASWQLARHGVHVLRGDAPYTAATLVLGAIGAGVPHLAAPGDARIQAFWSLAISAGMLTPLAFWALRRLRATSTGS
jgi:O-antigen/teichoic acid export membrane protein